MIVKWSAEHSHVICFIHTEGPVLMHIEVLNLHISGNALYGYNNLQIVMF